MKINRQERVIQVLNKIKAVDSDTKSCKLIIPTYYIFEYKGFKCYIIRCLDLDETWVGLIRVDQPLEYPEDAREQPFGVGVDFLFEWDSSKWVGFHTNHLNNNRFLLGVTYKQSSDYVALELRSYIDKSLRKMSEKHKNSESSKGKEKRRK